MWNTIIKELRHCGGNVVKGFEGSVLLRYLKDDFAHVPIRFHALVSSLYVGPGLDGVNYGSNLMILQ